MARRWNGWDRPWLNPIGESIYFLAAQLLSRRPVYDSEAPASDDYQPEIPWTGLKFCRDCNTGTLHTEYWWALEQETTIECHECGTVFVSD